MSNDTSYAIALQKIKDYTQIPQENIVLAATHSHTGSLSWEIRNSGRLTGTARSPLFAYSGK